MKQPLIAVREGGLDGFTFRRRIPVGGGGNRSRVGGESDKQGFGAKLLAHQLTDVEFAATAHLCGSSMSDVGIVCPDNEL